MTYQEAIDAIKEEICGDEGMCTDCCVYGENICEYDMAIEALREKMERETTK